MAEATKDASEIRDSVVIYTDGGRKPNPGPGGYGVILVHPKKRKEISGGFLKTTNNRMEIYAAIQGLEALKRPCQVKLWSDSRYLVDAMSKGWVVAWRRKGWRLKGNSKAANVDLWQRLLSLCEVHQVKFVWLRGHAGHRENERCDVLSTNARENRARLEEDTGYVASVSCEAQEGAG